MCTDGHTDGQTPCDVSGEKNVRNVPKCVNMPLIFLPIIQDGRHAMSVAKRKKSYALQHFRQSMFTICTEFHDTVIQQCLEIWRELCKLAYLISIFRAQSLISSSSIDLMLHTKYQHHSSYGFGDMLVTSLLGQICKLYAN